MSRYRLELHVSVDLRDTDAARAAFRMDGELNDVFALSDLVAPNRASGAITLTDTETGERVMWDDLAEMWSPAPRVDLPIQGTLRVLIAEAHEDGDAQITRIYGELRNDDFRACITGPGLSLHLKPHSQQVER